MFYRQNIGLHRIMGVYGMTTFSDFMNLQKKSLTMWLAVPQVMNTRIWLLATANPIHANDERKEACRMIGEKQQAFLQSIYDVNEQLIDTQTSLYHAWLTCWQELMNGNPQALTQLNQKIEKETIKILDKSISPYAKAVYENNKRLNKKSN